MDSSELIPVPDNVIGGKEGRNLSLTALPGDASDRSYFRASFTTDNGGKGSLILMVLAKPEKGDLSFITVQRLLREKGIPVPAIVHYEQEKGVLILEDCGQSTLEDMILRAVDTEEKEKLYKKAIDILADIQYKIKRGEGRGPAFTLFFDEKKLMWELEFMVEHFIRGYLGKTIPPDDRRILNKGFRDICAELAAREPVFTHRDYHSRNIMVQEGRLKILDFQDARMGPCQYDLVSLLRDSYSVLPDELVRNLVDYYRAKREEQGVRTDRQEFMRLFHLMSIQRNLKAIGTFAFQKVVKGNGDYVKYISPTLNYVRKNLERDDELAALRGVMERYLP